MTDPTVAKTDHAELDHPELVPVALVLDEEIAHDNEESILQAIDVEENDLLIPTPAIDKVAGQDDRIDILEHMTEGLVRMIESLGNEISDLDIKVAGLAEVSELARVKSHLSGLDQTVRGDGKRPGLIERAHNNTERLDKLEEALGGRP